MADQWGLLTISEELIDKQNSRMVGTTTVAYHRDLERSDQFTTRSSAHPFYETT
jgi:hypothetical protein